MLSSAPDTPTPKGRDLTPGQSRGSTAALRSCCCTTQTGRTRGFALLYLIVQGAGRASQSRGWAVGTATSPALAWKQIPSLGRNPAGISTLASSPLSFKVFMNINSLYNWVRRRSRRLSGAGSTLSPAVPCFPGQLRVPDSQRRKKPAHF